MLLTPRAWMLALLAGVGCGARSDPTGTLAAIQIVPGDLVSPDDRRCLGDLDCVSDDLCFPQRCVSGLCQELPPVVCDDGDPCTDDTCEPTAGTCDFRPLAFDEDGDGFRGPRPGFRPGAPGACGDDCNDASPDAFPGGIERCDGVDNDCNGIIDENAAYLPVSMDPVMVPDGAKQSSVGGISWTGSLYAAGFAAQHAAWTNSVELLFSSGDTAVAEQGITSVNADTFAGPLIWTGSQLASAWEDRRDGDFEIYFNRLDADGNKLGPDVRVTNAEGFSLRADLLWDGAEFVVVWNDRRNNPDDYQIFGQRISREGKMLGDNIVLTPPGLDAEAPSIAQGVTGFAMTFNVTSPEGRRVVFRTMSTDLQETGDIVDLGGPGSVAASLVWAGDRYVAAWSTRDVTPGPSILAATLTEDGALIEPPRAVTGPAPFARGQAMLPLGNRLLLVWAEEAGGAFDLYTKQITLDLRELSPAVRITSTHTDSVSPAIAFGPEGDVGILYEDLASGSWQVYFTRLSCLPDLL